MLLNFIKFLKVPRDCGICQGEPKDQCLILTKQKELASVRNAISYVPYCLIIYLMLELVSMGIIKLKDVVNLMFSSLAELREKNSIFPQTRFLDSVNLINLFRDILEDISKAGQIVCRRSLSCFS